MPTRSHGPIIVRRRSVVVKIAILAIALTVSAPPSAKAQPPPPPSGPAPETYSKILVAYTDPDIFPASAIGQLAAIEAGDDQLLVKTLGKERAEGVRLSVSAIPGSGSAVAIHATLTVNPNTKLTADEIQRACFGALKERINQRLAVFYGARRDHLEIHLTELENQRQVSAERVREMRRQTRGLNFAAHQEAFAAARAALAQAQADREIQESRRVALLKSVAETEAHAKEAVESDAVVKQLQRIAELRIAALKRARVMSEKSGAVSVMEVARIEEEVAKAEADLKLREAELKRSLRNQELSADLARLSMTQQESETRLKLLMERVKQAEVEMREASKVQDIHDEIERMERSLNRLEEKVDSLRLKLHLMHKPLVH